MAWRGIQECHADRVRQAVLLGTPGTKRTIYLEQAAEREGLPVLFVDWKDWESGTAHMPEGEAFVKIDPPVWESCELTELGALTEEYRGALERLAALGEDRQMIFLNHPDAIGSLLDKRLCKERLRAAGLPVTEMLNWDEGNGNVPGERTRTETGETETAAARGLSAAQMTTEQLLTCMQSQRIFQVFVKPVTGSGAAGVSAFRYQPRTGRMALYTCALLHTEYGLINTKRLRCFTKREEIVPLLDGIFKTNCIVERWYAKAEHAGYSYDLRMVMQEGSPDFLLARLSKGPITNLHLNNHPLEFSELGLPEQVAEETAELCRQAMECFPGLRSAGIDLLLERGSLRPRIIEMNAQGDLIYRDIFHENRIYRHQAALMRRWCKADVGGKATGRHRCQTAGGM